MNIELRIERLILDGFDLSPRERPLVRAAAEAELSRLLAGGGLAGELAAGGALPSLRAGSLQLPGDGDAHVLGERIARAVYEGIGDGRVNAAGAATQNLGNHGSL